MNGNHYQVNWQPDSIDFPPGNYYRIRVIDNHTGVEWGHADVYLGNTGKEFRGIDATEFVPLLDGRTIPIKFRIDQGATIPPSSGGTGGGGGVPT